MRNFLLSLILCLALLAGCSQGSSGGGSNSMQNVGPVAVSLEADQSVSFDDSNTFPSPVVKFNIMDMGSMMDIQQIAITVRVSEESKNLEPWAQISGGVQGVTGFFTPTFQPVSGAGTRNKTYFFTNGPSTLSNFSSGNANWSYSLNMVLNGIVGDVFISIDSVRVDGVDYRVGLSRTIFVQELPKVQVNALNPQEVSSPSGPQSQFDVLQSFSITNTGNKPIMLSMILQVGGVNLNINELFLQFGNTIQTADSKYGGVDGLFEFNLNTVLTIQPQETKVFTVMADMLNYVGQRFDISCGIQNLFVQDTDGVTNYIYQPLVNGALVLTTNHFTDPGERLIWQTRTRLGFNQIEFYSLGGDEAFKLEALNPITNTSNIDLSSIAFLLESNRFRPDSIRLDISKIDTNGVINTVHTSASLPIDPAVESHIGFPTITLQPGERIIIEVTTENNDFQSGQSTSFGSYLLYVTQIGETPSSTSAMTRRFPTDSSTGKTLGVEAYFFGP